MGKIELLSSKIANLIAAGEVIERPASVVKELIENSIDAHSTRIIIQIARAGRGFISVTDNGSGMDKEDAKMAFVRHATSKIHSEHDLFRIQTLGFRGEALPSIAAVAKVTVVTATADGAATKVIFDNNKLIHESITASSKGTVITVEDLFLQTPARLKHLKSDFTEIAAISDVVSYAALAHPEIQFEFLVDGKLSLRTPGNNKLSDVIASVFGLETFKQMIPFQGSNYDFKVSGYIANTTISKSNRYSMIYLLNGRPVRLPVVYQTVMESYHTYIPEGRYPIFVIAIETDPVLTDINVHPSKHEVRLSKEDSLASIVRQLVSEALKSVAYPLFTPRQVLPPLNETPMTINYQPTGETSFVVSEEQPFFVEEQNVPAAPQGFPANLSPLAQLHLTYLICSSEQGFYLIDQHAAMERINYERLMTKFSNEPFKSQELLIPFTMEFTFADVTMIDANREELQKLGIVFDLFGTQAIRVTEIPLWAVDFNEQEIISYAMDRLIKKQPVTSVILRDHAIATMSCKTSLKANKALTIQEMEVLISRLSQCNNPYTCPHGRPTMIFYSLYNLEHTFKRI